MKVLNIGNNCAPITRDAVVKQESVEKGAAVNNEINIPLEAQPWAKDYTNQKLGIAVEQ